MVFLGSLNPFGMSGEQIYHNFRGNTGDNGQGLWDAAFQVQVLVKNYEQRTKSITGLTAKMEGAWEGGAAGAARRGAGPLAVEHGLAQDSMLTAHTTLQSQVDAFVDARRTVTEVPPTPEKPGVWDNLTSLGGAGRNYDSQMRGVSAANDHNVQIMQAYEGITENNTSRMPTTYGRITDDYSDVGIEKPPPPPPPYPGKRETSDPGSDSGTYPPGQSGNNQFTNPNGQGTGNTGGGNQNGGGDNIGNPGQTDPNDFRPPPSSFDPPRTPFPPGQNPGQNPNQPGMPGMLPPAFGPGGGGGGDMARGGMGGRSGFGPGGSGGGAGGAGGGSGAGGPGSGRGGMGSGFGPGGAAAAAEGAAARGGLPGGPGGRGGMGGMGGMGHGGGGRGGQGEDDAEHERPSFLVEPDPHDTFGTDEVTAPPVIGE